MQKMEDQGRQMKTKGGQGKQMKKKKTKEGQGKQSMTMEDKRRPRKAKKDK